MFQFLTDIASFAMQATIIVAALLVVIAFIASLISKSKSNSELSIKDMNKQLQQNRMALFKSQMSKKDFKKFSKDEKAKNKDRNFDKNLYVIEFKGDIKASEVEQLRNEVSTVLGVAKQSDKVLVCVESPGGMVHTYGLAASQLQRIKDRGVPLVVCVDKIAASGGYMMASIANELIAAPFAIIGSIGVVASLPNFNKLLKKNDVDYLEITAGEYKRTLTPLGEITEPGMKKFKAQIEDVHELFKDHVKGQRPQIDLSKVATGEYWYGQQAKGLNLVDEIGTSDDYLLQNLETYKILKVKFTGKKTLVDKINESLSHQLETAMTKVSGLLWRQYFQ